MINLSRKLPLGVPQPTGVVAVDPRPGPGRRGRRLCRRLPRQECDSFRRRSSAEQVAQKGSRPAALGFLQRCPLIAGTRLVVEGHLREFLVRVSDMRKLMRSGPQGSGFAGPSGESLVDSAPGPGQIAQPVRETSGRNLRVTEKSPGTGGGLTTFCGLRPRSPTVRGN